MDLSDIDPAPGHAFSAKVRSFPNAPVASLSPGNHPSFRVLVAFGRCRFRLSVDSAALLLQPVLGAKAGHLCVSELDDRIYDFWVSSKHVGFLIYGLRQHVCMAFKLFFFLSNDSGIAKAKSAIISDQRPQFEWVEVASKKRSRSYAEVVRSPARQQRPLTGANAIAVKKPRSFPQRSVPVSSVFS